MARRGGEAGGQRSGCSPGARIRHMADRRTLGKDEGILKKKKLKDLSSGNDVYLMSRLNAKTAQSVSATGRRGAGEQNGVQ